MKANLPIQYQSRQGILTKKVFPDMTDTDTRAWWRTEKWRAQEKEGWR